MIGRATGMDSRALNDLEKAALLHDLGKLALPGTLLRKAGALDATEWDAIRSHPFVGAEMVRRIPPLRRLGDTVQSHHERLDGSGYPSGLQGGDLTTAVRILAIADSFDAMTSDRPYRPGLSTAEAIAELRRCAVVQLDGEFVQALAETLPTRSDGLLADVPEGFAVPEGESAG
jgi:HD-GYP domain-containing protein (c-di-GMP phosphodiesterase class II)